MVNPHVTLHAPKKLTTLLFKIIDVFRGVFSSPGLLIIALPEKRFFLNFKKARADALPGCGPTGIAAVEAALAAYQAAEGGQLTADEAQGTDRL